MKNRLFGNLLCKGSQINEILNVNKTIGESEILNLINTQSNTQNKLNKEGIH